MFKLENTFGYGLLLKLKKKRLGLAYQGKWNMFVAERFISGLIDNMIHI